MPAQLEQNIKIVILCTAAVFVTHNSEHPS